jgi:hypothetical protein
MSPRTLITDEQIIVQVFVGDFEFNQFFGTTVFTGTDTSTSVTQTFKQYFPGQGIITGINGAVVITGSETIQVGFGSGIFPNAIVAGSGVTVNSGTNVTTIHAPENFSYKTVVSGNTVTIPTNQQMIVDGGITIATSGNLVILGELVAVDLVSSGTLEAALAAVEGTDVDSINNIQGAVTVAGTNIGVFNSGNTISLSAPVPNAIIGGSNVQVSSGTNSTTISSSQPPAIVGGSNITVTSGTNSVTIVGSQPPAILGDNFIGVVSGTNAIRLSADAFVAGSSNLTVVSGSSTVTLDLSQDPSVTSITATTVTGTTGQFSGTLSAQAGNFSTSLTISGLPAQPAIYPERVYFNVGSNVSTNLATALGFLFGTVTPIHKADLGSFNQVRFVATQGVTGSANSRIRLNYATSYQSAASGYNQVLSTAGTNGGVELNIASANQIADSGWLPLRSAAKANNLFLAVVASGGDGAADPAFGPIYAEFR